MSVQLHALTALPCGQCELYPVGSKEAGIQSQTDLNWREVKPLLTRIEPRFLDLPVRSLVPAPTTLYRFLWGRNWIVKRYIHQSGNTKKHYHTLTPKTLSYTNTKNTNIRKHQKHYHTLTWNSTIILVHQHQKHYHTLTPKAPSYANTKKHYQTLTRESTITN